MALDMTNPIVQAQLAEREKKVQASISANEGYGTGGYTAVYSAGQWYNIPTDVYTRAAQGDVNARLEVSTMTGAMMYRGGPQGTVAELAAAEYRKSHPIEITSVVVKSPEGNIKSSAVKSATGGYTHTTYYTPEEQRSAAENIRSQEQAYEIASRAAYEAKYRANYYGMPGEGLPDAKTIGDTKSEKISKALSVMSTFGMADPRFAKSQEYSTGFALESLRQFYGGTARTTVSDLQEYESTKKAQYYSGELQKLASRPIEKASEYHYLAESSGISMPANPWEYQADLSVEFLKGYSNANERDWFSPVSGEMEQFSPGMGLQEWSWQTALHTDKPENYQEAPAVSFIPALQHLADVEGEYGPYGSLFGGPDYVGTPSSEGIRKQESFEYTPEARKWVDIATGIGR